MDILLLDNSLFRSVVMVYGVVGVVMIFHQHACIDKVSNIRNQDAVAQKKNEEKRTAKKREEYVVTRQPPVAKTSDAQKSTSYTRHPTLSDKCLAPPRGPSDGAAHN